MDQLAAELMKHVGAGLALVITAAFGAIAALIPALRAYALKRLEAETAKLEAQRQAALGVVCEVEAATKPQLPLKGPEKKALAVQLLAERAPGMADPAKLDELIESAVQQERQRRSSEPPHSGAGDYPALRPRLTVPPTPPRRDALNPHAPDLDDEEERETTPESPRAKQ